MVAELNRETRSEGVERLADHEEGGRHVMPPEDLQELRGVRPGPVVERQRDFSPMRTADGDVRNACEQPLDRGVGTRVRGTPRESPRHARSNALLRQMPRVGARGPLCKPARRDETQPDSYKGHRAPAAKLRPPLCRPPRRAA